MSNPIKVGIVGLGRAGWGTHLPVFDKMPEKFVVAAVCDTDKARIEFAKEERNFKGYSDIMDLINDPDVELVDIATRSCDHAKHAMMALKAGKDVVIEKPVGTNYKDCKELIEYAQREDTPTLYFRQNRRIENTFLKVKEVIDSGILGTVTEINIEQRTFERRDDWQTIDEFGGGLLLNWGPHIVDHSVLLLDSEVEERFGMLQHSAAGGDREDHLSMHLIGKNGRKVNMWISGASAINQGRTFTVYGNRGAMEVKEISVDEKKVYIKYIDPKQELPEVIANPGNPPMYWGKTGTFEAKIKPDWIEERYDLDPDKDWDWVIWEALYETHRNGVPYPIKPEEILNMMDALTKLHDLKVWDLTANRDKL